MPDVELKPQVYTDPRPQEDFDRFHARARSGPAGWTYEPTRYALVPFMLVLFRVRAIGSENVPNGPVILVPNHASFMDHFFTAGWIRRRVRFMAKSQLFQPGLADYIFSHGGVFPVRRGQHDEDAFITAFKLLDRGEAVVMYAEGGRTRTGEIAAEAKPGVGRLALESGAPVVPVAILGSYQVRNWKRLQFPRVTVQYGTPVRFERVEHSSREQQQEVADYVLDRVREIHSQLKVLGHRGSLAAKRSRRKQDRQEDDERYAMLEREQQEAKKREEEAEAAQKRESEEKGESEEKDAEGNGDAEGKGDSEEQGDSEAAAEKEPEPQA
jgi:1-acyl-sn-glycerol-3-phosphate acyltransferase